MSVSLRSQNPLSLARYVISDSSSSLHDAPALLVWRRWVHVVSHVVSVSLTRLPLSHAHVHIVAVIAHRWRLRPRGASTTRSVPSSRPPAIRD
jgi:hypothetical protein